MTGKEVDYTRILTEEDKIRIYFFKKRGKLIKFTIQYSSLINGKWRSIVRVDNCHGYPHKHTYHLHRKEFVIRLGQDNNAAFTETNKFIIKRYKEIKENFIFVK